MTLVRFFCIFIEIIGKNTLSYREKACRKCIKYRHFNIFRPFGIELEADPEIKMARACPELASLLISNVLEFASERPVRRTGWMNTANNDYWHVKTDSSCGRIVNGKHLDGIEVVSYKASGNKDIEHIADVAERLCNFGLTVNSRCALHVHVDVSDFDQIDIGRLIARWLKVEQMMMNLIPNRRRSCCYCKPNGKSIKYSYYKRYTPLEVWNTFQPSRPYKKSRRMMCNLTNYALCIEHPMSSRKTVEFRFPEGSFNRDDVKNWIRLFLMFVEETKLGKPPATLKPIRNIEEFLRYFGLSEKGTFFIFDKHLLDVKNWIYKRIFLFGKTQIIRNDSFSKLQLMNK